MIKNVQITNGIAVCWTGSLDSFSDMVHLFNATKYSQLYCDDESRYETDLYGSIYVMTGTGEKRIEIDDFVILKNDGSIVVCKPDMLEEVDMKENYEEMIEKSEGSKVYNNVAELMEDLNS